MRANIFKSTYDQQPFNNLRAMASPTPAKTRTPLEPVQQVRFGHLPQSTNHNYLTDTKTTSSQPLGWPLTYDTQENWIPREPANIPPSIISQDDARQLAQYMKNYPKYDENSELTPLNLAIINNRPVPSLQTGSSPITTKGLSASSDLQSNSHPTNSHSETKKINLNNYQERSDKLDTADRRNDIVAAKGFRSERASSTRERPSFNLDPYPPHAPAKKLINQALGGQKLLMLKSLDHNCITRSVPMTSRCEDHLIKRLNQDATEGRTAEDVGRRVCCALFWHKDCISRVVSERCPDSSPAATDFLMGSRNLDLGRSCLKFNRDGCNSTTRLSESIHVLFFNVIIVIIVIAHSYSIS